LSAAALAPPPLQAAAYGAALAVKWFTAPMAAALAAGRRSMDWVGVCLLGCIPALGGGTIRVKDPIEIGFEIVAK